MKNLSLNLISLILGLSCLVAGEAFSASSLSPSKPVGGCEVFLKARPFRDDDWKFERVSGRPTVVVGESRMDEKGGGLSILSRTGRSWNSSHIVDQTVLAQQGDPRTLALLLDGELAHFLGVSIIDEHNITVPNSVALNSRIEKLNTRLALQKIDEIKMRFVDAEGLVDEYSFVRQFLQTLVTPIAKDGEIRIHDVSYHLGGIIVPNKILEDVRKVLDMDMKYARFLTTRLNKVQDTTDELLYQWLIEGQYGSASAFLDTVLGNTVAFSANTKQMMRGGSYTIKDQKLTVSDARFSDVKKVLHDEYMGFFGALEKPTLRTAFKARIYRYPPGSFSDEEKKMVLKDRADFIAQSSDINWDEPLSFGNYDPEHVLFQVNQRIEDLKKALAAP